MPPVIKLLTPASDAYVKILEPDRDSVNETKNLDALDEAYSAMTSSLDDAWNGPAATCWPTVGQGVSKMGKLRVLGYFNIMKLQIQPAVVGQLQTLYPDDFEMFKTYSDLDAPLFYARRFRNLNAAAAGTGALPQG